MFARADAGDNDLQVYHDGEWQPILLKGVNMGIAKPGYFPGEAAITQAEYARWFRQIGEMNANVVRVYTIHPPGFYEALKEYNRTAKQPLYLLQGVWVNEENLVQSADAFAAVNTDDFQAEIRRTIDLVHGNAELPARAGHASGRYVADVSSYVIGWVLGIEWDPAMVASTDAKHAGISQHQGRYFRTNNASPFEIWLAGAMETAAAYEQDKYGWQRPISFTNWVTTDLLKHPSEPLPEEDMSVVDPNHISPTDAYQAGQFASYHVYPYYPDFLNYDRKLNEYVDSRGEKNGYAGYLNQLKSAHHMPVLIAEFGVPSSRGMAHRNVNGLNQGFLTEEEQGEIDARLWQDIRHEGMAGGLVFTWQDEWFKRTWNTMDYDDPERRPLWSNAQTGEQQFGLLAFDPGKNGPVIRIDGDAADWDKAGIPSIPADSPDASVTQYAVTSDERYVYFRLDMKQTVDWTRTKVGILIDSIDGQGQQSVPGITGLTSDAAFDFSIELAGPGRSRVLTDSYYDPFEFQYGHELRMVPLPDTAGTRNNGRWNPIRLALNKELVIPDRQGEDRVRPFESYETGELRYGNGNPEAADYDSLADVSVKDRVIEIRIPWQLLNVKDPSSRKIMGDLWKEGLSASRETDGFRIAVTGGNGARDTIPAAQNGMLPKENMFVYQWDKWSAPQYRERLKTSYYVMQQQFAQSDRGNP
ncbi:hypothetical protein E5161_02575 [Cohnella pontilimi]|uniref:Uncharacterized protein n=2 Tax=Cohnella pontilimi TaxID=2564100 RepID=A0A4U0FHT0_9BACL|nr:hypothetical protein E5161_02575 [Cohnella pontilimi]